MSFKDTKLFAFGKWLVDHFILFVTFIYGIVSSAVYKLVSVLDDSKDKGSPWSLRRVLAVAFAVMFYKALAGILAALGSPNPLSLPIVVVLLAAPLIGVVLMLFFTTWEALGNAAAAARGVTITGVPAETIEGAELNTGGK